MGKFDSDGFFGNFLHPVTWNLVYIVNLMIKRGIESNQIQGKGLLIPFEPARFCIFCAYTRPRYQVNFYRSSGYLNHGSTILPHTR